MKNVLRLRLWPLRVQLALLVLAAGIFVGIPWSYASYGEERDRQDANSNLYVQDMVARGYITQAEWDEHIRLVAEREASHRGQPGDATRNMPTPLLVRLIWVALITGSAVVLILRPAWIGRLFLAEFSRRR